MYFGGRTVDPETRLFLVKDFKIDKFNKRVIKLNHPFTST